MGFNTVHSISVIQSLSALPNTFRHMPMIFPAGSNTNCSDIVDMVWKELSTWLRHRPCQLILVFLTGSNKCQVGLGTSWCQQKGSSCMTVTSFVLFTHRKVTAFVAHLIIKSILLACNVYAIQSSRKLLLLTMVIPTPRGVHNRASDICDWNTSWVCQYCCHGPELVPHLHNSGLYLHGWAVFKLLVM